MPRLPIRYALLLAGGLICAPVPTTAQAETLDQLDALSDAAADEGGGIALAREQAQRGAYLEALSTLERVLGTFPRSSEALLTHAIYLCEIDDRQGGRIELQLLRERDYTARQLSDARAICSGTNPAAGAVRIPAPIPTLAPAPPPASSPNSTSAAPTAANTKPKVN